MAVGATIGLVVVTAPCALFGEAALRHVPVRALRVAAACLFLLLGLWSALAALRLI